MVSVVGRHDRHNLRPGGAGTLTFEKALGIAIRTVFGQTDRHACGPRAIRVGRKHSGHDLKPVVEACGGSMHCPDEAPRASPDHGQPQTPTEHPDHRITGIFPTHWQSSSFGCHPGGSSSKISHRPPAPWCMTKTVSKGASSLRTSAPASS